MNRVNLLVSELNHNTVMVTVINKRDLLDYCYISRFFPDDNSIMSKMHFSNMLFKLIKTHRVDIITPEVSLEEIGEMLYDLC